MTHRLLRRLSLVGGILGLLLVLPQGALAQLVTVPPGMTNPEIPPTQAEKAAPPVNGITLGVGRFDPSRHITVNITDAGFEKQDYTVLTTLGQNAKSDQGTIVFQNNGTVVHTATMIQSTGYLRVSQDQYERCGVRGCANDGPLDTAASSRSDHRPPALGDAKRCLRALAVWRLPNPVHRRYRYHRMDQGRRAPREH